MLAVAIVFFVLGALAMALAYESFYDFKPPDITDF